MNYYTSAFSLTYFYDFKKRKQNAPANKMKSARTKKSEHEGKRMVKIAFFFRKRNSSLSGICAFIRLSIEKFNLTDFFNEIQFRSCGSSIWLKTFFPICFRK